MCGRSDGELIGEQAGMSRQGKSAVHPRGRRARCWETGSLGGPQFFEATAIEQQVLAAWCRVSQVEWMLDEFGRRGLGICKISQIRRVAGDACVSVGRPAVEESRKSAAWT